MADTVRTRAALITLLADNTTKAITPQVARDLLVSLHGVYGEIYVDLGVTAQTFNIAPAVITCFNTAAGSNGISTGTTPDKANNKITVLSEGVYVVRFNLSLVSAAAATYKFHIRVNGVEQMVCAQMKSSGTSDINNGGTRRVLNLAANDIITVYGEASADGKAGTIEFATLNCNRIA